MNDTLADPRVRHNEVGRSDAKSLLAFGATLTIYLLLAFYRISNQSFWTDEVYSINERSLESTLYRVSPLYFVSLDLWSRFAGNGEAALRALSVMFGAGAVCMMFAVGRRCFDEKTGIVGALLLATSPYFIWYAQEVRYISLALLTSLALVYSFQLLVVRESVRSWACYIGASFLALLSFMTGLWVMIAQGLYLVVRHGYRPMLGRWLVCGGSVVVLFALWFGVRSEPNKLRALITMPQVGIEQPQKRSREMLAASDALGLIPYTFYAFSVGFSLGPSLAELHRTRSISGLSPYAPMLAAALLAYGGVFLVGISKVKWRSDGESFVLLWLLVPIVLTFLIVALTTFNKYNTRYVAICLPAYLLILARGIVGLKSRLLAAVACGSLLLLNGVSLGNYYFDPKYAREDARAVAEYLEARVLPNDLVWLVGNPTALRHYYNGPAPLSHIASQRAQDRSEIIDSTRHLGGCRCSLWVVEIRGWESDPQGNVRATLQGLMRQKEYRNFSGAEVYGYFIHG